MCARAANLWTTAGKRPAGCGHRRAASLAGPATPAVENRSTHVDDRAGDYLPNPDGGPARERRRMTARAAVTLPFRVCSVAAWTGASERAEQLKWHGAGSAVAAGIGLPARRAAGSRWPGAWNVRPRGTGTAGVEVDAGVFTLAYAWPARCRRQCHGRLAARAHPRRGAGPADRRTSAVNRARYDTHRHPGGAATALAQLDAAYGGWMAGVRGLGADGLARPAGRRRAVRRGVHGRARPAHQPGDAAPRGRDRAAA